MAREAPAPAVTQESEVSSRVADHLFWIGRYAERAEGLVRLLRMTILSSLSGGARRRPGGLLYMRSLLGALTHQSQAFPVSSARGPRGAWPTRCRRCWP